VIILVAAGSGNCKGNLSSWGEEMLRVDDSVVAEAASLPHHPILEKQWKESDG